MVTDAINEKINEFPWSVLCGVLFFQQYTDSCLQRMVVFEVPRKLGHYAPEVRVRMLKNTVYAY